MTRWRWSGSAQAQWSLLRQKNTRHDDVSLDRNGLSDHSYNKRAQDTMTLVWIGTGSVITPITKEHKTRWRQSGSAPAQWSFLWQKSARHDDVSLDRNGLSDHSYDKRAQNTMTSVWIGMGSVIIPMTKERKTRWRQSGSEWAQWSFIQQNHFNFFEFFMFRCHWFKSCMLCEQKLNSQFMTKCDEYWINKLMHMSTSALIYTGRGASKFSINFFSFNLISTFVNSESTVAHPLLN